ncbi:MAG: lamin tail domain-containing protein, partial [Myxococcota bacterium]|nr:lamin tail domain-containing protein [Myxococcota bacterium]
MVASWSTSWLDVDAVPQSEALGETEIDEQGRTSLTTTELVVGAHTVEIEVTDSDGQAGYASVTVQVVEVDDPPSVQISAPAAGDVFDEHDAVNFAGIAADDHDVTLLTVVWESDLHVSALDGTPPADNGAIGFQTDALVPGDHTIVVTVTDGGGHEDSDSVEITVIAENLAPSMPSVTISPLGPDTEDDLSCQASGSVDPEGELVSYAYAWDVDGVAYPWTGQVIDASETDTGEQWTCFATPFDPSGLEGDQGYATVIVGNTLPSYSSVVLTPTTAYEDTVLQCTPSGWFDPDGDPEGALYEWWVGGAPSAAAGDQLTGSDFDHFDDVYCVVVPFDGVDQGLPLTSNTVTISNTPPVDPEIQLSPDPLHYDEDLECLVVTADPDLDGDALTYTYQWTRNGTPEPSYVDPIIPAADTELGDEWTCEVQASDGPEQSGPSAATTWVVPYEGDLVITEVMIDPLAVDDGAGEYVEIYNAGLETLPLDGFELSDGGADQHVITSGNQADVVPGDYFVLGINANDATNGGVEVDYQYTD